MRLILPFSYLSVGFDHFVDLVRVDSFLAADPDLAKLSGVDEAIDLFCSQLEQRREFPGLVQPAFGLWIHCFPPGA
jgi:hypothetical protein